jgi:4-aminobutyrate aminotransferase/(S)-3-amino-2-methylpropionate transaminase
MNEIQTTDELLALEARYCSWGDTVHYNDPIRVFSECEGNYVTDPDGNRYLDMQSAYGSVNFGHRNQFFIDALIEQLSSVPHLASEYVTREKVVLSKLIADSVEAVTGERGRVHFNVGGAQAVDDSLKLIATDRGHRRTFAFEGSYHGRTIGASAITSSYRYRSRYGSFSDRAQFIPFPYCFRCPYGLKRESCSLYCVKQFERLFESEYQGVIDPRTGESEFAAFFVETVQGTGGYIAPPPGYMQELQRILHEHDILLVVDDIQMGFFRTGTLWSIEHYDLEPDILIFGKSLTNGLNPLSGMWAKDALIGPSKFPPGSTHSTFSNNPLGMRLGIASFDWIEQNDYTSHVADVGTYLLDGLKEMQRRHPQMGDVDGIGLAVRVEICGDDGFTPDRDLTDAIKERALDDDVETALGPLRLLLDVGGHYKNVFTLAPPLDIDRREVDVFLDVFEQHLSAAIQS